MSNKATWAGGLFAGMLIGFGNTVYCSVDNKIIAALLFAFALCSIRHFKLDLYTGSFNKVILYSEFKWWSLLYVLLMNFVGVGFQAVLMRICEFLPSSMGELIVSKFYEVNLMPVFFLAVCCGMLMSIATYPTAPMFLTIACVMVFLLTGMRHSIADFWYLGFVPNEMFWSSFWIVLLEVTGNALGGLAATSYIYLNEQEKITHSKS